MKETVQICNNGHLLDWMENGTLETVLTEIFTNEHKNFSQSFRFGSKFALDFPSQTEWRITAPNERCHGRFTQKARQYRIKRYILLHNIYHSLVCVVISVKRFSVQKHLYESTSTDMCRVLLYRLKEWPR